MEVNTMNYDVAIVGAGLAGLSLARQLLLESNLNIVLLERRSIVPGEAQKVGESLVQIGGYYFAKVLQMEEHLLHEHFMKYNLRFYFKTQGRENNSLEDYSQAYIRNFSNIPCYQLDRNIFEKELLEKNLEDSRFTIITGAKVTGLQIKKGNSLHHVEYEKDGEVYKTECRWLIDTTGRNRLLAREFKSTTNSPIKHGAAFMWVDGIVDIEKLTRLSSTQERTNPDRKFTGHLPFWLATNHFMGEGFWLWTIPLKGKTSIGLVYDSALIDNSHVNSPEKLLKWITREFPLFSDDLEYRGILDFGAYKDFAYDCGETISADRWAMSGMSGRFQDPLYSPGSDFIAFHNALIVDAIKTDFVNNHKPENNRELKRKCWLYELTLQSIYRSLLPSYATSYDALGDQETFVLKYTWELSVYFSYLTLPWVCNLQSDTNFIPGYLSRFSKLGEINHSLQRFISDYFQWKKQQGVFTNKTLFHDFTELDPLNVAESCFYKVDLNIEQALKELDRQLENLLELARFIVAHVTAVVAEDKRLLNCSEFVRSIDFKNLTFDPAVMESTSKHFRRRTNLTQHDWQLDPTVLDKFLNFEVERQQNHSRETSDSMDEDALVST